MLPETVSLLRSNANFRTGGGVPFPVALWNNRIEEIARTIEAGAYRRRFVTRAERNACRKLARLIR